jgi:putative membrane protein
MNFLIKILVIAAVSFGLARVLNGVHVDDFWTAIVFAVVLAVLNVFAKPLLILLTLPVTILTLGLFLFVINALIVLLASRLVHGFRVDGFWWGLLFSLILSFIISVVDRQVDKDNNKRRSLFS